MPNIDREQLTALASTNFVQVGPWIHLTDIDVYEKLARETAQDNIINNLNYFTLGLAGEAGEIANKVKKVIRDNDGEITEEQKLKIAAELGDVFWYLVGLCRIMGVKPSTVLAGNINKLQDRKKRGTIGGSGDQR